MAFGIRLAFPPTPSYPLEHLGHLANALLIAYAITKFKLLDMKLVLRRGLVYSTITVFITSAYLLLLLGLQHYLRSWSSTAGLTAIFIMAFIMAWLFNPLRMFVQRVVDRLFYGETYDYRQMVISFTRRMSNVLDLGELAEAMLKPIAKAVGATQASLLLPDNGDFSSQYAECLVEGDTAIHINIGGESRIINWLTEKDALLTREVIDVAPEFKGIQLEEEEVIKDGGMELLMPMKSKGKLVGILALGKKISGGIYSGDDMDLVTTLAHEAAMATENAQLYANHRYFHERLDEEISRCSRFGDIFSLLFLDMDLFKTYNDVYGHMEGDEMLRHLGHDILGSIRGIDMAFRYGGDEFTVVLPQASLDDAYVVAERIRKSIESKMDA
jgi:GGDEF domain-containing protein